MNLLFVGHVIAFSLAALACFASLGRARRVEHPLTRRGLVALLFTSGLWAAANAGYLLAPGVALPQAFYVLGLVFGILDVGAWLYFCAAYTGRSPGRLPYSRLTVGVLLGLVALKVTNPIHGLYFAVEPTTTPFSHLAIHYGVLHWLAMGLAYSLALVGFFMLAEHFHHAGADTRPLVALVGLTALPVGFNVLGVTTSWLIAITYEPLGVAAFALGVLYVYAERFQTVRLAGDVDDPVVVLDQDERVRDFNREAEALFPDLTDGVGDPLDDVLPRVADGLDDDGHGHIELARDGETKYYHVVSNPFVVGETRTGRSVVLSDVTRSEEYRRRLERKTEQLDALNRVVRHDIRNDMTVVLGFADLLSDHVDEAGEDLLERLYRRAEHTLELTDLAREFVEVLAGEGQVEPTAIDLRTHLETELETARESFPDARFRVDGSIPDASVRANEMLSSVFRNLLFNAVVHNDQETPEVTVSVAERDDDVVVRVADNGPGISDDMKERVFGKGEKGLDSEGTGIGLYLVQTLVSQFGGSVHAEDNDPRGAVFVVELPTASTAGAETEAEAEA